MPTFRARSASSNRALPPRPFRSFPSIAPSLSPQCSRSPTMSRFPPFRLTFPAPIYESKPPPHTKTPATPLQRVSSSPSPKNQTHQPSQPNPRPPPPFLHHLSSILSPPPSTLYTHHLLKLSPQGRHP